MKNILLVDLSSIFFGIWHASAHEEQNAAFNITKKKCQEVMAWRNGDGYDAIAWCVDTPPYQRSQIRSDYKANREKRDPKAFDQYLRIQQWLKAQGELVWGAKGFEADDILATACAQAPDDVDAIDIHTGDKDLLQLVDERVQILPIRTDGPERFDAAAVQEKFGVSPSQFREFLALCGDKSDNIPGVPKVGPKKAAWLLNELGNLERIREAALDVADRRISPALRTLLNDHHKDLIDSELLVKLRTDAPIRFSELWEERERQDAEPPPEDTDEDAPPEEISGSGGAAPAASTPLSEDPAPSPETPPQPEASNGSSNGAHASNGNGHARAQEPEAPVKNEDPPGDEEPKKPAAQAAKPASFSIERAEFALTYEPHNSKMAWWLAQKASEARVFPGIINAPQAYIILQTGKELGLTAMASLRGIKMVEGQPMIMSTLLVGIILQSGLAEYFECTETTAERATYITKRKGRPQRDLTYTIEEARQAELVKTTKNGAPNNWMKRPKTMLRHRAAAELARMVYPEIASGVYVFGEDFGNGPEESIDVTGVEVMT